LTHYRDRAIEQKFIKSNEISDSRKITAQERYNSEVERKLLDEQRKFNSSKILLDELKEKIEVIDRNISCSNKKIEAVKREIEKVKKSKLMPSVQKPVGIAKLFSSPPPVISNMGQGKVPSTSRSGFLNFFRRN
jgi:predicted house-cleaning noncanonical NTP pyrophosphatase (MazG superfamily)